MIRISTKHVKSLPGILKVVTLFLGLIVVIIGYTTHYGSSWTINWYLAKKANGWESYVTVCHKYNKQLDDAALMQKTINMPCYTFLFEEFFLVAVTFFFILSIASVVTRSIVNVKTTKHIKLADAIYHGIAAVNLLLAGCFMISSAFAIIRYCSPHRYRYLNTNGSPGNNSKTDLFQCIDLLHGGKITAGLLAIFNGVLYTVTVFFLASEPLDGVPHNNTDRHGRRHQDRDPRSVDEDEESDEAISTVSGGTLRFDDEAMDKSESDMRSENAARKSFISHHSHHSRKSQSKSTAGRHKSHKHSKKHKRGRKHDDDD